MIIKTKAKQIRAGVENPLRLALRKSLIVAGVAFAASAANFAPGIAPTPAFAEEGVVFVKASQSTKTVKVVHSKPKTIRTDASFNEIVVGNPEVARVTPLTDRSFYVVGHGAGSTGIALYNSDGALVSNIEIEVGPNTSQLNTTLKTALPDSRIKATTTNGRVILQGNANDAVDAQRARAIAERFDSELIDTVEVEGSQQVKLEVRFIEATRASGKDLGVSLQGQRTTGTSFSRASSNVTNRVDENGNPVAVLGSLLSGAVPFGDFLTSIVLDGTNIDLAIRALEDRGLARRLAEPNLVTLSGDTASFLAGGEFPIPVAGDDNAVRVVFKEFGVGLEFTPTVLKDGLINLKLSPEVSQLDFANAVNFGNGGLIPALIVRRAETTLELRDGQSFVLGGLLQSATSINKKQVPWLGDVPILGALFRSSAYQRDETDLVIVVTPRLVKPLSPGNEPVTPLDATAPASDVDLFVNGDLEVSRAHLRNLADARSGVLKSGHVIELD